MSSSAVLHPTLSFELSLSKGGGVVIGIDEVGRGAIAGPVCVGAVAVTPDIGAAPAGIRDSKLLTPRAREKLAPLIQGWAVGCAVGETSAEEIDQVGIVAALRLAAMRAIDQVGVDPTAVIVDGSHDWLSPLPQAVVHTRVKADLSCVSVAAASIVAKVYRDGLMRSLHAGFPQYGWDSNKGYASSAHTRALAEWGVSVQHRRSWRLPGVS